MPAPMSATPQSMNSGKVGKFEAALNHSEKREGITDFKNKNLHNNMKGLLK